MSAQLGGGIDGSSDRGSSGSASVHSALHATIGYSRPAARASRTSSPRAPAPGVGDRRGPGDAQHRSPCARSQPSTSTPTIRQGPLGCRPHAASRPSASGWSRIAVRQDAAAAFATRPRRRRRAQVGLPQPGRAGEPAHEQRSLGPQPPQREIGEIGIQRARRDARASQRALQRRVGARSPPRRSASAAARSADSRSRARHHQQRAAGIGARCRVCSASEDSSSSTDRSGAQAGVTRRANGWPSALRGQRRPPAPRAADSARRPGRVESVGCHDSVHASILNAPQSLPYPHRVHDGAPT